MDRQPTGKCVPILTERHAIVNEPRCAAGLFIKPGIVRGRPPSAGEGSPHVQFSYGRHTAFVHAKTQKLVAHRFVPSPRHGDDRLTLSVYRQIKMYPPPVTVAHTARCQNQVRLVSPQRRQHRQVSLHTLYVLRGCVMTCIGSQRHLMRRIEEEKTCHGSFHV